ncbi:MULTISPECIES: hypothetical protein [Cyanophyceae]|uniref:hypothetical protein n=1 Tax=Cyanophyceae TaxID=3028117 RepID=UPI001686DF48|nr:hypothetical protein [Trichocoleus sp. FACHB-40]MBD2001895.1 hypothetical protein [Trichocoleus sp. FACHB-40]
MSMIRIGDKFVIPNLRMESPLVRVGGRIINLDAIAHAEYDATGSTLEIFFQILPSIVLSDDEAECLWKLLEQSALDVMPEENAIAS